MTRHHCDPPIADRAFEGYGDGIDEGCHEDERGFFWVGNGEYGTPVEFCPFCGTKAPRDPRETMQYTETPEDRHDAHGRRRYRGPGR